MYRVLIDFHHYELSLSIVLLLQRLGCEAYLPNIEFFKLKNIYGFPYESFHPYNHMVLPYDGNQTIDFAITSCPTNYRIYINFIDKVIQQIGNHEWTLLDFPFIMTSDLFTLSRMKNKCKHICYYYPEVNLSHYKPNYIENRNIRSYIHNLHEPYTYDLCKVCNINCSMTKPDYETFLACQKKLGKHNISLVSHRHAENNLGYHQMPEHLNNSRLTWHFKTMEGYGFSAITSMFCGTPIIMNPTWLAGTTLGSLSLSGQTAIHCEYSKKQIVNHIEDHIKKDQAKVKDRCVRVINNILDFEYEADKIKKFLEVVL